LHPPPAGHFGLYSPFTLHIWATVRLFGIALGAAVIPLSIRRTDFGIDLFDFGNGGESVSLAVGLYSLLAHSGNAVL
jgi:hypothetical protein